ncbi:MAG: anti-phage dCTP deaminase [Terracidiphilus sp.]|jgi:deoxycytidylate deaminase
MSKGVPESPFSELVFGFVYPVGTNADPVLTAFRNFLGQYGYDAPVFRISDQLRSLDLGISFDDSSPFGKRDALIKAGNKAREMAKDDGIVAVMAVSEFASQRVLDEEQRPMATMRTAHLVRSLKRPEEVALFREVYKSGFYLIGIANDEDSQMRYLTSELGMTEKQAKSLVERDQNEQVPSGQRTRDTFYLADVFVQASEERYKDQIDRFLELVFGHPFITPLKEEHAMFLAYASAARSAQLGRQVGAAIATPQGDVLAVGMNEVPSPRGGVYWEGDDDDSRDHTKPVDPNAEHRDLIIRSIQDSLGNEVLDLSEVANLVGVVLDEQKLTIGDVDLKSAIRSVLGQRGSLLNRQATFEAIQKSDLRLITEYGRAVHGEMDAILTCARLGISVRGNYLYVTTFPCHNCTRHIVASGIRRVYYVEPYPKSKARDLHSDAICFDLDSAEESGRIPFLPFIGIGPRRYLDFFSLDLSSGRPIQRKGKDDKPKLPLKTERAPRVPLIPLNYLEREDKLLDEFKGVLEGLQGKPSVDLCAAKAVSRGPAQGC